MNRASRLLSERDAKGRSLAYERVLRLVDLSVEEEQIRALRRELLRWHVSFLRLSTDRAFPGAVLSVKLELLQ